tara:strand:+ start:34 stop:321 length:288 start_codon:yes stop_codon:yes gene_type:complete
MATGASFRQRIRKQRGGPIGSEVKDRSGRVATYYHGGFPEFLGKKQLLYLGMLKPEMDSKAKELRGYGWKVTTKKFETARGPLYNLYTDYGLGSA